MNANTLKDLLEDGRKHIIQELILFGTEKLAYVLTNGFNNLSAKADVLEQARGLEKILSYAACQENEADLA